MLISDNARSYIRAISRVIILLMFLGVLGIDMVAFADDCDHWGRRIHVSPAPDDTFCLTRAGIGGSTTKRLEDPYDFDYFLFYIGYDDATEMDVPYKVELTNTSLTRPKIDVGTFYDDAPLGPERSGQTGSAEWYAAYQSQIGGMSLADFQRLVTVAPNLLHDGVYNYVNGEVVIVNAGSDDAIREMFHAVPVGTNLATNERGEKMVRFTPPEKGAYLVMISNYSPTRRKGRLTGSYTLDITKD